MEERQFSVISNESSEKPLLSPGSARAMDLANMRKQRLVLDWRVPALTGRIGRIHSKQGFSEVSILITGYCLSSLYLYPPVYITVKPRLDLYFSAKQWFNGESSLM